MGQEDTNIPQESGKVGYGKPPVEHQFKPGNAGGGRKSAGASIKEWINSIAERDLTAAEIRKIARDESIGWTQRAAAERILRTLERGDIADFAGLLRGENNIEDLRAMGINTEVVKKLKEKKRTFTRPNGDKEEIEEVIEREIELHDRAGNDFDRILDRTEGKPNVKIEHGGEVEVRFHPITLDGDKEASDESDS